MNPQPLNQGNTWRGLDTFSTGDKAGNTYSGLASVIYNPNMADVDDNTKILADNSSKAVTNVAVRPGSDGFDLLLLHGLKTTSNHVDEAEIVATWHFNSLEHMEDMVDKFRASVLRQKEQ